MKALWNGFITLGHLGFPVQLFSATRPGRLSLRQLNADDLSPIELVPYSSTKKKPVKKNKIVRGVEQPDGSFITLSEADLAGASEVGSKAIAITQFSELIDIDPLYFQKPYYIMPGEGGERAYALIREVLTRTKKVAIAHYVLYGKEHIGVIWAHESILVLQQLRFAQQIVPRSEVKMVPLQKPTLPELDAATELVNRLTGPFYAEDYRDEQANRIEEIVQRKAKGLPPKKHKEQPPPAMSGDNLVEDLRRSLEEPPPALLAG